MKKSTIYIDIEDDIASIIEKVSSAEQKIVALVLPKRPSVLQSSVNMRLLRQSSDSDSKSIVLITNDDQITRLASEVGIHLSSSLQSKPAIPPVATDEPLEDIAITDTGDADVSTAAIEPALTDEKAIDPKTPVGVLAGDPAVDDDEIDLDDGELPQDPEAESDEKIPVVNTKKKVAVPSFSSFRTKMFLGVGAAAILAVFVFWATVIAPKASIIVKTEKSNLNAKITVTASKAQTVVDEAKLTVPADRKEDVQKLTGTFTATGQKDVGTKASGTIAFKNCENSTSITIPSGTGVSKGAYTFITQKSVTLSGGTFSGGGSVCTSSSSEAIVVIASASGDQYNIAAGSYTVAGGYGNIAATGSAMGGGTTKIVKVVTDEDIQTAKTKVMEKAADNVKGKLSQLLTSVGIVAIDSTFSSRVGDPVSSLASGVEANGEVAISVDVTSSMLGIKLADINPLLTKEVNKLIDPKTQKIYDIGTSKAILALVDQPDGDSAKVTITTSASVGPLLDKTTIAKSIAGKKAGEAKQIVSARPGVSNVDVRLSPFWVFSIPKNIKKIAITINE